MSVWLAVVGWDDLTHADAKRGGGPLPWHRSHRRLLDDPGYWELPAGPRAVYAGVLLLALNEGGTVELTTSWERAGNELATSKLTRRLNLRVTKQHLISLDQAGLLVICASREQAEHWHGASPRVARDRDRGSTSKPRDVYLGEKQRPVENSQETSATNGPATSSLDAVFPPTLTAAELEAVRSKIGREIP